MKEIFYCIRCGGSFIRSQKDVNRGKTKFCTRQCSDQYKKERAIRYASTVLNLGRKQCKACNATKKLKYFPPSKESYTGYHSYCRICVRELNRAQDKKRWSEKRDVLIRQRRNANYRKNFGITIKEYEIMLEAQGNKCAICGKRKESKSLHVDHDHKTGKVRGILCNNCNFGLGLYKDDVLLLKKAVRYLNR